jgi:hypothetical protein
MELSKKGMLITLQRIREETGHGDGIGTRTGILPVPLVQKSEKASSRTFLKLALDGMLSPKM